VVLLELGRELLPEGYSVDMFTGDMTELMIRACAMPLVSVIGYNVGITVGLRWNFETVL
jgi:hypothetical protein